VALEQGDRCHAEDGAHLCQDGSQRGIADRGTGEPGQHVGLDPAAFGRDALPGSQFHGDAHGGGDNDEDCQGDEVVALFDDEGVVGRGEVPVGEEKRRHRGQQGGQRAADQRDGHDEEEIEQENALQRECAPQRDEDRGQGWQTCRGEQQPAASARWWKPGTSARQRAHTTLRRLRPVLSHVLSVTRAAELRALRRSRAARARW
jgi:hypothetical protein